MSPRLHELAPAARGLLTQLWSREFVRLRSFHCQMERLRKILPGNGDDFSLI